MAQDRSRSSMLVWTFVGFFVEKLALCGEAVFRPCLLVMDKGALARAVEKMLEGREGDGLYFRGHEMNFYMQENF